MKSRLLSALAGAALCSIASQASAATLLFTDLISASVSGSSGGSAGGSAIIGIPSPITPEITLIGPQDLDFNAGIDGNIFTISSSSAISGMFSSNPTDTVTFSLFDLDFGTPLLGFNVLQSLGPVTIDSITANSVTFTFNESPIPQGIYFQAEFITSTPAVPEPSTWAMMILGFASVGYMTYRRRKQSTALSAA